MSKQVFPQPPSPTTTSFFEYETGVLAPVDRPALYAVLPVLLVVELDIIDVGGVISRDLWTVELMIIMRCV